MVDESTEPQETTEALSADVVATLVANHREFLRFIERRVGSRAVAEDILLARRCASRWFARVARVLRTAASTARVVDRRVRLWPLPAAIPDTGTRAWAATSLRTRNPENPTAHGHCVARRAPPYGADDPGCSPAADRGVCIARGTHHRVVMTRRR